jgi:hypothetical protein
MLGGKNNDAITHHYLLKFKIHAHNATPYNL